MTILIAPTAAKTLTIRPALLYPLTHLLQVILSLAAIVTTAAMTSMKIETILWLR